jgi:4-amino-4-deoxychorismate lyase
MSIRKFWTKFTSPPDEISPEDCFETIKVELSSLNSNFPQISFLNLPFHEARMKRSIEHFELIPKENQAPLLKVGLLAELLSDEDLEFALVQEAVNNLSTDQYSASIDQQIRLRLDFGSWGYSFTIAPFIKRVIRKVGLIGLTHEEYPFKFRDRNWIDQIRNAYPDFDEIIMTKNGLITDSLWANLAFFDGSNWFTPENSLLAGTKQALLLDQNQLTYRAIKRYEIGDYQTISFINALYNLGELTVKPQDIISI